MSCFRLSRCSRRSRSGAESPTAGTPLAKHVARDEESEESGSETHEPAPPPPPPPISHAELRQEVIDTCRKMNRLGINQGTSGNLSCRVPDGSGFLITASGVAYDSMTVEQVVYISLDGGYYYGAFLPSSEWRMHYDVYMQRPDARAVLHAHPTHCTALAAQRRGIPAFHYMVAVAGGKEIPCAEYASFGTQELSDAMLKSLGPLHNSVLLANHGMVCFSGSLQEALWLACETECLARQYVLSLSTGGTPTLLPDEEMDTLATQLSAMRRRAVEASSAKVEASLKFLQERRSVIETCQTMVQMDITTGLSGSASCRVEGGFLISPLGVPFERLSPEHIVFVDAAGAADGGEGVPPASEWRLHRDVYRIAPDAATVIHCRSAYCTALAAQRRCIPSFHYMVGVAGDKEVSCADYANFDSDDLGAGMMEAMRGGARKAALLANHGMICWHISPGKTLWLANELESLARQYICALSTRMEPILLSDAEMDIMLAKFASYGKPAPKQGEQDKLTPFQRRHSITAPAPRFAGPVMCDCCAPPE